MANEDKPFAAKLFHYLEICTSLTGISLLPSPNFAHHHNPPSPPLLHSSSPAANLMSTSTFSYDAATSTFSNDYGVIFSGNQSNTTQLIDLKKYLPPDVLCNNQRSRIPPADHHHRPSITRPISFNFLGAIHCFLTIPKNKCRDLSRVLEHRGEVCPRTIHPLLNHLDGDLVC
ncbi:hypothetical protein L1887_20630 [Cichorium endivia]|nr:hypothetical protein L1887_20630 [Cichorium endivia]